MGDVMGLFEVRVGEYEPCLVRAKSRSAARYDRFLDFSDVSDITFRDFVKITRVRTVRLPVPPRHPAMTAEWRELARHALGLPNRTFRSYRNKFVTGAGPDGDAWSGMVAAGLAKRQAGDSLPFGGYDLYWLTPAGALSALEPGEKLCPEDFPGQGGSEPGDGAAMRHEGPVPGCPNTQPASHGGDHG